MLPEESFQDTTKLKMKPSYWQQKKFILLGIGGLFVAIILVIGSVTLFQQSVQKKSQRSEEAIIPQIDPNRTLGVIVRSNGETDLPLKKEIDQNAYKQAVAAAWDEAFQKAPTQLATFPNSPQLITVFYSSPESTTAGSLVLYKDRAIVIETKPVTELPDATNHRISLNSDKYQLNIVYEYTKGITELDVAAVLTEAFNQLLSDAQTAGEGNPSPQVIAFEALLR